MGGRGGGLWGAWVDTGEVMVMVAVAAALYDKCAC